MILKEYSQMVPRFALVEFNEFIFDNFKDEIEIYKDGSIFPIEDLSKIGPLFRGRFATDEFNDYYFFEKKQLYMAIPPYLFEMFSDLKTTK